METLGDAFPKEIERCKRLIPHYEELGAVGFFGKTMIEDVIRRAEQAQRDQDVVAMVRIYPELQGCS